jgi:hypothetical protein
LCIGNGLNNPVEAISKASSSVIASEAIRLPSPCGEGAGERYERIIKIYKK